MTQAVEIATSMINAVRGAVIARRPMLLSIAGPQTVNEAQLIEVVRDLLQQVMDWEDYNRRVEFTMRCMEGDLLGQLRKCKAVRNGEEALLGEGFEPVDD